MRARARACIVALGAVGALLPCWRVRGRAAAEPRLLVEQQVVTGEALERELLAGSTHVYTLALEAGELVDALLEQRGADVSVAIQDPQGRTLLELDLTGDPRGFERVLWIAPTSGSYRLRVSPQGERAGPYVVTFEPVRPATSGDAARVSAARTYEEAAALIDDDQDAQRELALGHLEQASSAFRAAGDRRAEAEALRRQGAIQLSFSRGPALMQSATRALELFSELGDRASVAWAQAMLGRGAEIVGDVTAAREHLEQAAQTARQIGDTWAEAALLNDLADFLRARGEIEPSIEMFERAVALAREARNTETETHALNNLGVAYRTLGEYSKALLSFEQALPGARAIGPGTEARLLLNTGNAYRSLGEYQRAFDAYERYLAFARAAGSADDEARALSNMAAAHIMLGAYAPALEESQRSLELRRTAGRRSGEALSLRNVAESLDGLGRSDEALAAIAQALAIHRELHESRSEVEALATRARIQRNGGQLEAALVSIQESLRLSESLRSRLTSPDLRTAYVAAGQDKCELLVDLQMRLHAREPQGGHAAAALEASETARARVLLEALVEARADVRRGIDPALLAQERDSQKQLDEALNRLGRLSASKAPEASLAAAALEADAAGARQLQLLARVRQTSPAYAELTQPSPLTVPEIQRELDADTLLLEFALGQDGSFLFALTASELTVHALPPGAEIERSARDVYALMTARQQATEPGRPAVRESDERLPGQAAALSRMLLGPVAERLQREWATKRLAIVASGALAYLPFGALPRPGDAAEPLLRGHEIVSLPSASVLHALRRQLAARRPAAPGVAVLADPVFDKDDPRVARALSGRTAFVEPVESAGRATVTRAAEGLGRRGFPRLPFSRAEARAIAALTPSGSLSEATDFRASRAWIDAGHLEGRSIVHFATHGLLNSEHPALSGLLLSLVDERAAWQDGFLRMTEIYNLRLDAELVVLSACQTALGREVRGEGLIGVTRGFMYAGAPRVAASLWQVDDESTAELMRVFYRGMLREGRRPADALRQAQLELSGHKRWAAPYYWAGFVLQGEWR